VAQCAFRAGGRPARPAKKSENPFTGAYIRSTWPWARRMTARPP